MWIWRSIQEKFFFYKTDCMTVFWNCTKSTKWSRQMTCTVWSVVYQTEPQLMPLMSLITSSNSCGMSKDSKLLSCLTSRSRSDVEFTQVCLQCLLKLDWIIQFEFSATCTVPCKYAILGHLFLNFLFCFECYAFLHWFNPLTKSELIDGNIVVILINTNCGFEIKQFIGFDKILMVHFGCTPA